MNSPVDHAALALSLYDSDVIMALADPEPEPGEDSAKAKSLAVHSQGMITPAKPCPRTHRLNVLMPLRV
jgi:hypothetical protein